MLEATEEERDLVEGYYLSQSPTALVRFSQKIYSESVAGHRHDVWDVHASDGRWWVITNPTNLYSQEQFPNMDIAVTFHLGLCIRIPRASEQQISDQNILPFANAYIKLRKSDEALAQARNIADYQAIGMRCREALLKFVGAAQDVASWSGAEALKRADFRSWVDVLMKMSSLALRRKSDDIFSKLH